MRRAIKCAGWVLACAIAAIGMAAIAIGGIGLSMAAGVKTASLFGLPEAAGFLFMIGYIFGIGGAIVGAQLCMEHNNE